MHKPFEDLELSYREKRVNFQWELHKYLVVCRNWVSTRLEKTNFIKEKLLIFMNSLYTIRVNEEFHLSFEGAIAYPKEGSEFTVFEDSGESSPGTDGR